MTIGDSGTLFVFVFSFVFVFVLICNYHADYLKETKTDWWQVGGVGGSEKMSITSPAA